MKLTKQDMHTGDIIFVCGTNVLSQLIRWITNSKWSHVAIVYRCDDLENKNSVAVTEAQWGGFVATRYNMNYINRYCCVARPCKTLTLTQRDKLRSNILKNISTPYDFSDLFRILFYKYTGIKFGRTSYRKLICSEAVSRIYKEIGVTLVPNKNFDLISPQDIFAQQQMKKNIL